MFCPKCGAELVDRDGWLYCEPGDMSLAPALRKALHDTFVTGNGDWEVKPATIRWGGRWFCPSDGTLMREEYGVIGCPTCERPFPSSLLHQLLDPNLHTKVRTLPPRV